MRAGFQHAARTQAGKGTDIAALAQYRTVQMAVGFDHSTFTQGAVLDHTVRTDDHVVLDDHPAFENHVDVDEHVAANANVAAHIEACRITQRDTQRHQAPCLALLIVTF